MSSANDDSRALRTALLVCAAVLVAASLNHARLAATGQGVVWRHALFCGLDFVAAVLVASRWQHAVWPIALLAAQQTYSHGSDLVTSITVPPFDATSLGVVVFFPLLVTLLWRARSDERASTSARPRRERPGS